MLNIIRTQELSIEENPLGSEITGLKGKQKKLRLDGDTFSRQLCTDEVSSSITKVEPVVKTVERKETTGE